MKKVKVWGEEIDSCWKCYHHGRTDFDELCCSYTGTIIKSDINEDCPFSKPITKEVIEGFGFIYNYNADLENMETPEHSCNPYQCILKDVSFCNSSRSIDLKMTYLGTLNNPNIYRLEMYERNYFEWYSIFEGRLNNPIELEFILKSLGVIE